MSTERKRILLVVANAIHQHARDCLQGVYDYALRHAHDWDFLTDPFDFYLSLQPGAFAHSDVHGALVWEHKETDLTRALTASRIPAVNLTMPQERLPFPSVVPDYRALGHMAAVHLNQPAITRHLYVGPRLKKSFLLLESFQKALKELDREPAESLMESLVIRENSAVQRMSRMRRALKSLCRKARGRVGVYTYSDSFGNAVIKAALEAGLRVPGDVAVLGTDNERLICSFSRIPLSSIAQDSVRHGFEAARALHDRMQRKKVPEFIAIEPLGVEERFSSSRFAVDDPLVAKALTIIQDQAVHRMNVKELVGYLPISRRNLEQRFRAAIGATPHDVIESIRIERATKLLRDSDQTNAQIAVACGFSSPKHFEDVIRKRSGRSPSSFRKKTAKARPRAR